MTNTLWRADLLNKCVAAWMFCWLSLTAPPASANTLVDNVNGYTLDQSSKLTRFTYLVMDDDGRITDIGSGIPPTADRRIDGRGKTLLPGMIDASGNVLALAQKLQYLDLTRALNREEIVAQIRNYATDHPGLRRIVGYGWRSEALNPINGLEVQLLDLADRQIFLLRDDGQAAWANAAARTAAGMDLAGLLVGPEIKRVRDAIPTLDDDSLQQAMDEAFAELASLGLTTVHDRGAKRTTIADYEQRVATAELPLRIYATLGSISELEAFGKPAATTNDELIVRGVNLTVGSTPQDGAAMLLGDSVHDVVTQEYLGISEAELVRQIEVARRSNFRVTMTAANGDIFSSLNAFVAAGAVPSERHWIENVTDVQTADLDYLKQMGIIAAIEPLRASANGRAINKVAWRALADADIVMAAGSGFPYASASPFLGWHAAISRADGLTRVEAFRALTLDAAFAMGLEDSIGSLEVGKWADFVLLDRDPFEIETDQLREMIVLATWVAGERVWQLPAFDIEPPVPIAPNIDLSLPVEGPVELEAPEIASALDSIDSEPIKMKPFRILGAKVPAQTSTRLTWSAGEYIEVASGTAPVLVVHGARPGPVLCLTGAVHGDELNGIEIVREVLYGLDPTTLSGTVVGVPIVNVQGFRRSSRYLVDRRDLNRYFPGNPTGSSASRIAHSLFKEVISKCDALVDVHTGSFQRSNLPQVRANLLDPAIAALAHGFREMVIVQSQGGKGTLRRATAEAGIPAVTIETGAPMELQLSAVADGVRGVRALISDLGMDKRVRLWGNPEPIYYSSTWVRANRGGVLLSKVNLGQRVRTGELLGSITDPITNISSDVFAPRDGRILGMALNQIVMPGFAMYRLGMESREPEEDAQAREPSELEDDS